MGFEDLNAPSGLAAGVHGRAARGFAWLAIQRGCAVVVTAGGGIALARLLQPDAFGTYAILGVVIGVTAVISDLGLGAALVQRRQLDAAALLGPAFALQFSLAVLVAAAVAGLAPIVVGIARLPADAVGPLRGLALLIPLAALRMPPAVLLERQLAYRHLAAAELAESVVFYAGAASAAWTGLGVWSFVLGAVGGRVANVAVLARPVRQLWVMRWAQRELRPLLRFGLPYQGSALVTMVRDAASPVVVGASSGVTGVGLLNWAAALAFQPLQFVTIGGRVLFPVLSRLQQSPAEFAELTGRALHRIATLLYPCAFLLFVGASALVEFVYGEAWRPAIPAVRLFCVSAVLGGTSNILVHALYGAGRADLVFRLNVAWTVLVWVLTVALVPRLGFLGFAVASATVAASGVMTACVVSRLMPIRILPHLRLPFAASLGSALFFAILVHGWVHNLPTLIAAAAASVLAYVGLLCAAGGQSWRASLIADWRAVWAAKP